MAEQSSDEETGTGSLPVVDEPPTGPTAGTTDDGTTDGGADDDGAGGDPEVMGTAVERPLAEAAAERNEGARAGPLPAAAEAAPRAEPSGRGGLSLIPRTGADAARLALTGAALVALGTVVTRAGRRRRRTRDA